MNMSQWQEIKISDWKYRESKRVIQMCSNYLEIIESYFPGVNKVVCARAHKIHGYMAANFNPLIASVICIFMP